MTVVDASNRPRRRRRISRRTFRGPSVYGQFALEVGARTITTRDSRTCGLGAPDDFFVLSASAFLRAAGRDAWKRTQPSLKPSRAEPDWVFRCVPPNLCPGSRQNETNQRGVATRSWRIWWSCFFGRRGGLEYRSGMRVRRMVARKRSLVRSLELSLRGRSRFADAKLKGAKFAQLAQLLSEGFSREVITGHKGVDGPARSGFRMPPILFKA